MTAGRVDAEAIRAGALAMADPCPICTGREFIYMWSVGGAHLGHCSGCGLVHRDDRSLPPAGDAAPDRAGLDALTRSVAGGGETLVLDERVLPDLHAGRPVQTIVVGAALATARDPAALLRGARARLAKDGLLVVDAALIDGMPGRAWGGWTQPVRWHFTRQTLHLLLLRFGFDRVWCRASSEGRSLVSARVAAADRAPALSIIVPVFNERHTCAALLDLLLAKEIPGVEREIVIVESNSTDGTRAIVEPYRDRPGVRLILEDRPRGKGHAVRTGLAQARGSLVLIQDADLEYDLEDYDSLLRPLLDWQTLFVLGSRHAGHWKMRVFNDAPVTAGVFNLGHLFYTWLVNAVLRTDMSDPFTMFKVFRRDCLHGLAFEGRRFDFDFELVMKLVRKGYVPLELPVNYTARSFAEGKKVSFVRDGLTWVWVVAKFGFGPLGPGDDDRFLPAPQR